MSKPYQITSQQTFNTYFLGFFFGLLATVMGASFFAENTYLYGKEFGTYLAVLGVVAILILCVLAARYQISRNRIKKRNLRMLELHAEGGMKQLPVLFAQSSLHELDKNKRVRNRRFENFVEVGRFVYADYAHDIFRKTKNGDIHTSTHYYSIMAAKLPRKLPHVVFDSLQARRRQFRFMFAGNQLHDLEGDFNKYFDVYFPYEYHIDSLSFLAPDVLWAIRDAAEYDIEIVGDNIFIFGAQSDPDIQIQDMTNKLDAIMKALGRSLKIYRDERLPYADGRQRVAPLGAMLAKNLTLDYVKLACGLLGMFVAILLIINFQVLNNVILYIAIISFAAGWSASRNIRQEKTRRNWVLEEMEFLKKRGSN